MKVLVSMTWMSTNLRKHLGIVCKQDFLILKIISMFGTFSWGFMIK